MVNSKEEYRRKLPHIQPKDGVFFITFCLKGALPKHIIAELSEQHKALNHNLLLNQKAKQNARIEYSETVEEILHTTHNKIDWLKQKQVAELVEDSLHFLNGKSYNLVCYCIMSNHVHLVIYNLSKPLYKIMHSLKSYTANECNKILNRSGSFWQREYFDRVIRDRNDLSDKISYTLNNPVKAGIVNLWRSYLHVYCHPKFIEE